MLRAHDLTYGYPRGEPVLKGVSASFDGGITAVVGPNGAGKSTLLRLLAGLLQPRSGRVSLGEAAVSGLSPGARAKFLAYVPQRSAVSAAFTARRVVELGRYALPADSAAIDCALSAADVATVGNRVFGTLSAGQQQRVALARALAQLDRGGRESASRFLLADEPTSALDPEHRLLTADIFRHLRAQGVGVVVVLHDLSMARQLADSVLVLDRQGVVAAFGPVERAMSPEVLEQVFAVRFLEMASAAGPVLIAQRRSTGPESAAQPLRL